MANLERMAEFFEARLDMYDEHMLNDIEGASEFYPFTASLLPENANILDLGCGTGLELGFYFERSPNSHVTGIDLSRGMLDELKKKFSTRKMTLVCDSYFDYPLGEKCFDAAVSVESLHHFTIAEKTALYKKVHSSLKCDGCFILTDYFALSEEESSLHFNELSRLKRENGISDSEFYHYDTPLTVEQEIKVLTEGGFSRVEIMRNWGATYTLKSYK